jgi:N-acetylglucosamine kinase-like BadF-type ATPase
VTAFLGIDVGGTATRWAAIDDAGRLLARGSAGGATGMLFAEAERQRFADTIAAIATAFPRRPVGAVHAGITGLGPRAHPDTRAIIGAAFGTDRIELGDDMDLAFRAVFEPGEGHLVSAGTGSIGLHLTAAGEPIRVGGRGILVDDAGSGSWIALQAIERLYRLIDERGAPTGAERLADAVHAAIGGKNWDDVRGFVYGSDRGRIGSLATAVAAAAAAGDPLARTILDEAAGELARLARALVARSSPLSVGFVGGVLDLDPAIRPALVAALPGLEVNFPKPDAALRAAELARRAGS